MDKPLMVDLYAGLGGWADGGIAEGYDVVGFDIERHVYGEHKYPAQLVIQDVLTLDGAQFKDAALIVASPPCQEYSYMAMPWKVAKQRAADYRSAVRDVRDLTRLFDACFRIQREASGAAGHHIPLVVENVRGAIPWVGRSRWNYGSYHLWGDVPALMPMTLKRNSIKNSGGSWFAIAHNTTSGTGRNNPRDDVKVLAHLNKRDGHSSTRYLTNPAEHIKQHGSGAIWFDTGIAALSSKSPKRKMASAMIAKIPLPLSRHIARVYRPEA
jgi:hypothetical protein